MKEKNKYFQLGLMIFSVVAAAILLFFLIFYLPRIFDFIKKVIKILMPINIGIVVAYLLNPIVDFLDGWTAELLSHTKLQTRTCIR